MNLQHLIDFVNETKEHLVVMDPQGKDPVVVLNWHKYQSLAKGNQSGLAVESPVVSESFANDYPEIKKPPVAEAKVSNNLDVSTESEDDRYYLEPVELQK